MIKSSTAVLAVADIVATVKFYCDVLGFRQNWLWGNPPTFGCVGSGKIEIFLNLQPELARRVEGHEHFFDVEGDVEALYQQHRAASAQIISPLENKPWGIREYTVRDPSGYHLRFSGPLKYERPLGGTNALPPHVRIEPRLATPDEYIALATSVGWNKDHPTASEVLSRTDLGLVAIDTRDNQTVGMLRITGDGRFFMFWDVIVRPSHQGQKIGAAMMEHGLAELRRIAKPGVFVGLYTGKPAFYEPFGFRPDAGGMHMML